MELATLAAANAVGAAPVFAGFGADAALSVGATASSILGATSSVLSPIFTGLSLASMAGDIFGGISAGKAASEQLRQQSEQDLLDAKQTELQGQQQQNDINENLLQTIAQQRLAYSGAGIDFSFGTPAKLENNLNKQAEMQLSTSRDNARLKAASRRRAAYIALSQRGQAQSAPVLAGFSSAGKTLAGVLS